MSNRTMLEMNHDRMPRTNIDEQVWAAQLLDYLRSGNPKSAFKVVG